MLSATIKIIEPLIVDVDPGFEYSFRSVYGCPLLDDKHVASDSVTILPELRIKLLLIR